MSGFKATKSDSEAALALALFLLVTAGLPAQDPRGAIVGQVMDTSGAVAPGVTVRAVNVETNVELNGISNESGSYELPYMNPGMYRLSVERAGFKTWTRPGIEVRMGERLRIDVRLELGDVTEVVEVTSQAPVLESTTATVGGMISNRQISNLPLRGGSLAWVFSMVPGAVLSSLPFDGPWNPDTTQLISLGGSGSGSVDYNLDGVSNNSYGGRASIIPPQDMVQEVRVDSASYDASVGHSLGGAINVSLKTGTNALHGTVGASIGAGPMLARDFYQNKFIFDPATGPITEEKIKANTPYSRWLRGSAAVGGPLYLPKFYDGRNRTFWMFGFQNHNDRRTSTTNATVPTEAQRAGDLSGLLALGPQYQVYDPMTTVPSGPSRFVRQPLPGNRIPSSRIHPTARKIASYFPLPNAQGTADGLNNFAAPGQGLRVLYQPLVRLDHNFSEKHRMFVRYSHSDFTANLEQVIPGSKVRGRTRLRPHRGISLDNVWVLSPRVVLDVRYGFAWFSEHETYINSGWDLTEFGFPQALLSQLNPAGIAFPYIGISDLLVLGNGGGFLRTNYSHSILTMLSWNKGKHSFRFGSDLRAPYENYSDYGNVAPRMDFAEAYTRGPLDNAAAAPTGQGLASFLFGIPTGGWTDVNDSRAEANQYYSGFVQDDWRISRNLTVNIGLRWEYDAPLTERFNRSTRDFDFQSASPIQSRARAAYARAPIPEIPAEQFRTVGGATFVGIGGNPRGVRNGDFRTFMPRIGFAYQVMPKVVLRGGYGIYFGMLGVEFADVSQPGFTQRTNIVSTLNNGVTYVASISDPLPFGLAQPPGSSGGLETYLGRTPAFFSSDGRRPYTQRWSYSVQVEPVRQMVFEAGYMGSRSARLRTNTQFNAVPSTYLSTARERDQAVIDYLSARATNPFAGIDGFAGSTFFATANTTKSQLLRPYPHFSGLSTGLPAGSSWYHALTVRAEQRFTGGLQFQANYTWSKTMEAASYLNDTDSIPEHVVSNLDRPHRIVLSGVYELPFGKNKRFLSSSSRLVDSIAGGWQIQAIFQGQSGAPLGFGNVLYRGNYSDIGISKDSRTLERWFNTSGFERDPRRQLANNIRYFPSRLTAVRPDGINIWDLSAHKNFQLWENWKLQLRAEAEGALNHPHFSAPNTDPTSTLFGQVTSTISGDERKLFIGAKLIF